MKELRWSHVWWPHLYQDLETLSKNFEAYQERRNIPPAATLHPWSWTTKPWTRINLDFAGPILGRRFMIMVSTTTQKMTEVLRLVLSTHGLPEQVFSDNGPSFNSDEFKIFRRSNGIKYLHSSFYHSSSNGLTACLVQTFKQTMNRGAH